MKCKVFKAHPGDLEPLINEWIAVNRVVDVKKALTLWATHQMACVLFFYTELGISDDESQPS